MVKKLVVGIIIVYMVSFDIILLMKVFKVIVEEKIYSWMVEVIVVLVVEFVGVQYGIFIFRDVEGKYFIEGEVDVDGGILWIL